MKIKKIYKELKRQNKPLFNISTLSSAYPTGDYLEGNFITVYTNNADKIDRYFIKKYGERSVTADWDDTDAEIIENWEYDTQAIFFTHLTEWAKMFSALIKDYEPLWNVDGTEVTTYGETHKEDKYGATHSEDKYGATQRTDQYGATQNTDQFGAVHNEDKYGNAVTTVATPQYSDTHTTAKTTYPDATERNTDKVTDAYGQHTITTTEQLHTDEHDENTRTDTHSALSHTDTHSELLHTDEHDARLHTNEFDEDEHDVTLRRTGNIGVTSSQKLVQDSIALYERQSFFSVILAIVVNEIGGIYYD